MPFKDCPHCDASDSIEYDDDYSQYLISVDGDNLELTTESDACTNEACGETVTITAYGTIHALQEE